MQPLCPEIALSCGGNALYAMSAAVGESLDQYLLHWQRAPTGSSRSCAMRKLVEGTVTIFGRLDAAVNNAGYTGGSGPLATQTEQAYDTVFNTNVCGLLFSLKHELRVMIEQGHGSIVNLSSTFGERGGPGASLYVASKRAVNGFTRSAALEVAANGIRVNAVDPGPVVTPGLATFAGGPDATAALAVGVPMGHLGHVDEIADVIQFLTSEKARFITGQIIAVNGGKTAR